MRNQRRVLAVSLALLFLFSTISCIVPQAFANDLPDALSMSYYITPNDPQVINVAQIICGPDFGKTDFWTLRSNVELLYHWVAGSVPHGIPTHITYKRDQDQWGTADYWQLSNRTLTLGHGDDEDQAILLASLIKAAGGPHWRVRIAKYGVYRLEFPLWGAGLVKYEKERLFTYYAVEIYDISSDPLNAGWWIYPGSHDWWTPLHPTTKNLLGWPLPFSSCEILGNLAFENPVCARRLKPEAYFYEKNATDPIARFNCFPQIPRTSETVKFDASTSTPDGGYINKHCWDFGDGTSVNVTNGIPVPPHEVYHSYGTVGNFTVTLTVFDSEARSNSTSKTIQIQGSPDTTPPDIAIISPANTTYTTTNIDLNYTINEPPSWTGCTIDDGTYVANATVAGNTTLYFTNGSHNIQLFANDTSGNMGASQKIYFTVNMQPPVANFTYDPKVPKVGETVTFDGSSSSSNGATITSYQWDFGDGQTASGQTATHTYTSAAAYMVTLNVTDSNGLWDIEQKQVQVVQPHSPKAEFTVIPETANIGQLVKFDAATSQPGWNGTSQMPITKYSWDFGDGNKTDTTTPIIIHAFSSSGIYYPSLTVYANGATPETDTITKRVLIISTPVGGYSVSLASVKGYNTALPSSFYFTIVTMLAVVFSAIRRKKRKE